MIEPVLLYCDTFILWIDDPDTQIESPRNSGSTGPSCSTSDRSAPPTFHAARNRRPRPCCTWVEALHHSVTLVEDSYRVRFGCQKAGPATLLSVITQDGPFADSNGSVGTPHLYRDLQDPRIGRWIDLTMIVTTNVGDSDSTFANLDTAIAPVMIDR